MGDLGAQAIFALGERTYTWDDLVLAGCLWGRWAQLENEVRAGLACLAKRDALDEADEAVDEDAVSAAAAEFRYARDLEAAEDMEAWLEARGLDADQWLDALRRSLLRAAWADDLDAILEGYPPDEAAVAEALAAEAICAGTAAALALRLAGRVALAAGALETPPGTAPSDAEAAAAVAAVDKDLLERALPDMDPDERAERLAELARIDAVAGRRAGTLVTPKAIAAEVAARALDWVRVDVRALVLDDETIAREAALCVREDGMNPAEVAEQAHAELVETTWYLDEAPAALREPLLGARVGEVIGPQALDRRFAVVSVVGKTLPSVDDEALRERAASALVKRVTERQIEERVRWSLMP